MSDVSPTRRRLLGFAGSLIVVVLVALVGLASVPTAAADCQFAIVPIRLVLPKADTVLVGDVTSVADPQPDGSRFEDDVLAQPKQVLGGLLTETGETEAPVVGVRQRVDRGKALEPLVCQGC